MIQVKHVLIGAALLAVVAVPLAAKKTDKAKSPAASESPAVAYVAGQAITAEELDKAAAPQLAKIRQQEFDIKDDALDALIQKRLIESEAAARNVAVPDLLKAEIEDKSPVPTKEEVDKFYETNKARMGNRTREDAGPDIERTLRAQKQQARRNEFLNELSAKASVKKLLDPPRMTVAIPAGEPSIGPENAPITIVEFSDFQCPFCRRAHPTIEQLLKEYPDKIRFVYRDYPLSFHPRATPASQAAHCAGDQGKYWEYHKNLMLEQGDLSDDDLKKRATTVGLDTAKFNACYEAKPHTAKIQAAFDDGAAVGVTGTPAFFVNGRSLVGAQPLEAFKQIIQDELARLESGQKSGTVTK